jgi:hypothetical protein
VILVGFDFASSASVSSVTDSQGNVFTQVGNQLTSPGGVSTRVYYASNVKSGADTVTVSLSANSPYLEIYLAEYSGVASVSPIDVQAGASGNAGAVSSGNATTTVAGDIVYGFCIGDTTCTAGSGFTPRSTFHSNLVEDMVAVRPSSYAATGSAGSGWTMQMVALKGAAFSSTSTNACDLNADGIVDSADVQAAINMTLGLSSCVANIVGPNICNVTVVQRVINASLGQGCLTSTGPHTVSLTWTASISANVVGYQISRGTTSGGPYTLIGTVGNTTSYTDTTVVSGQTYYYVVAAVDSRNNVSPYSSPVSAAVPVP